MERNRHGYWMKRLVVAALAVMLCIGLCGCSAFFDLLEDFVGDSENEERVPFPTDMTIIFEWGEIVTDPTETTQIEEIEPITGVVVGDPLNVRSGPGTNYKGVGSMDKGETVVIWELSLHGELPWGKTDLGWVCLDYVKLDDPDALLVSDEVVGGMTMVDNIRVYSGPGEHYKYVGTEEQDVRVEIRGFCGRWVRIQRGWVPLEMIYVDGTEGPEEPINATVNVAAINVRGGPGTNYDLVDQVDKGETLKIYYQVVLDGKTWGCSDIGWVFMDYMNVVEDDAIIGEWYWWTLVSDGYDYAVCLLTYKANGTFQETLVIYSPVYEDIPDYTRSYEYLLSGTYTFDGSLLIREEKDYKAEYPIFQPERGKTDRSARVNGNTLTVEGEGEYTRGTPEEVFAALKKNTEKCLDPAILGTWRDAEIDPENSRFYSSCTWSFYEDGFFTYSASAMGSYIYDKETGLTLDPNGPAAGSQEGCGVYSFDGTTLFLDFKELEHEDSWTKEYQVKINGDQGTMGNITIYKGTLEEVAERLFANVSLPETPTEPEQSAPEVLGTWYCIRGWGRDGEPGYIEPPYRIEVVTFRENGIVECQTYRLEAGAEAPVQDPESPWLSGGTYSYDNLDNGMMGEYDVTIEDGVLCVGCAGAMEFYHRGGVNEAVNTIRQKTAP